MIDQSLLSDLVDDLSADGELDYYTDAPLSGFSTFKIGGPASLIVCPKTKNAAVEIISRSKRSGLRTLVFGNASNVLFCDEGIEGVVVFTSSFRGINLSDGGIINAEAGAGLTTVSQFAQKNGFAGFEFACGIPGNIGGAAYMNAGAYEHSVSEVIVGCECLDMSNGKVEYIPSDKIVYGYRTSSFQGSDYAILSVDIKLPAADDPDSVRELMNDHLRARSEKQPLEFPSAGSVFKRYPGYYTSKLIDEAGLKGTSVGGAQVSEKHAGFIINRGGATAKDVLTLIKLIQDRIYVLHGIHIECEVKYVV